MHCTYKIFHLPQTLSHHSHGCLITNNRSVIKVSWWIISEKNSKGWKNSVHAAWYAGKVFRVAFRDYSRRTSGKYNSQYDIFMEWCEKHAIKKYGENVLLAYFSDLSKQYSHSSTWFYCSMMKATIHELKLENKAHGFFKTKEKYSYPKRVCNGFAAETRKFLLNASDEMYLMRKVHFSNY